MYWLQMYGPQIAITAFLLLFIAVESKGDKKNKVLSIILRVVATALVALFVVVAWFVDEMLVGMYIEPKMRQPLSNAITMALIIMACVLALRFIWKMKKKWVLRSMLGLLLVPMIYLVVNLVGYYWDESIPTVAATEDLVNYHPGKKDNYLAKLDGDATLQLKDNLPVLDGATALYPVFAAFANAVYPSELWLQGTDDDKRYLDCSTTAGAYSRLIQKDCDIIFVASPSKQQEQLAEEKGVELQYTPIGKECFVFFVNAKNSLEGISVEQVQDIYSGKLTEWSELGVKGLGKIRPFQREEGSGSQTYLEKMMGDIPIIEKETNELAGSMGAIVRQVADYKNYKNAIGYSFRYYCTQMVKNDSIKLLALNGVAPTKENIQNNTYPLTGDFYAVTRSNCSPETKEFLEWMVSEQGQELVEKTGYVSIHS